MQENLHIINPKIIKKNSKNEISSVYSYTSKKISYKRKKILLFAI